MKGSPLIARTREPGEARAQARTRNLLCERCGKSFTHRAGRRPSYCSDRCRLREFGRRRVKKALLGGDTGGPTKRTKIANENNALQRAKIQSSTRILGPSNVIAVEVFGVGAWRPRTGADGVAVERAQRRPRGLIDMLPRPRVERERGGDAWIVIRGSHDWLFGDRVQAIAELDELAGAERGPMFARREDGR